jgi:biopolymer transport protein ExbD
MKKPKFRLVIALILVLTVALLILGAWIVRAWQPSDMKIVNLQGHPVLRITAGGVVFDGIESKVAVINDLDGSLTLLKHNEKIVFRNDPAIQRDNDRYLVKLGDGFTFDVQSDGRVLVNGELYWRVFGYSQKVTQRSRFIAALVIAPFLTLDTDGPENAEFRLPHDLKNTDYDPAVRREHIMWIPRKNEMYFGDERLGESEIYYDLPGKVDELLKRQPGPNKIIYIAASPDLDYRQIVLALSRIRAAKESSKQVGLIVKGPDHSLADRFLITIGPEPDPAVDISSLKPSPLELSVHLLSDGHLKLMNGAVANSRFQAPMEAKGTVDNPASLSQSLTEIFQERKARHIYRTGIEGPSDMPEDERIEKTVAIKASPYGAYRDVLKLIECVKGTGANPIILILDDLPS